MAARRNLHVVSDFSKVEIEFIINKAIEMKLDPKLYRGSLRHKTVLMLFEKPSLRTRVSLESGINHLEGHSIFYSISDSPLGKMKENIHDTAKSASRYVDLIAARVHRKEDLKELILHSTVPVINLLDDLGHPCQILADLMIIAEKIGISQTFSGTSLKPLHLVYYGDAHNNVTYDLMRITVILGWKMEVCCPPNIAYCPQGEILEEVSQLRQKYGNNSELIIQHDPKIAGVGCDVVYADTWFSYGIKLTPEVEEERKKVLGPYQVSSETMSKAKPSAFFMHCLPATRGNEVTASVIDGKNSIVFDQAENRLHVQKSVMLFLLGVFMEHKH